MAKIESKHLKKQKISRKVIFSLMVAAALVLALSVTAYAVGLFRINMTEVKAGQEVSGTWTWRGEDGTVETQAMNYPDAGYVFTYEGEVTPNQIEFRPGWTPEEPEGSGQYYRYLARTEAPDGDSRRIPYVVSVHYNIPGFTLVLNGDCETVKEETWDDYRVVEITAVWNQEYIDETHYILMFDETRGFMISVGGTEDYETLEHIARELEIRETDEPVVYNPDFNIGILNVGRG